LPNHWYEQNQGHGNKIVGHIVRQGALGRWLKNGTPPRFAGNKKKKKKKRTTPKPRRGLSAKREKGRYYNPKKIGRKERKKKKGKEKKERRNSISQVGQIRNTRRDVWSRERD